MDMRQHLQEHHGVVMHAGANEATVQDLHHHDHTFNRPGHKLTEKLNEPMTAAETQRAKSDQWKPRGSP